MQLSVKDAAAILNVSENTVYGWIERESIPYYKINEQFRFNRAELLEWATARGLHVSADLFTEENAVPLPTFSESLLAEGIEYGVKGNDQASVLRAIVDLMKLPEEVDRDYLYQVLLARETLGSTGVGDGIAIPHVRNPVVLHVSRPTVTLCFLETPIDFKAIDGQPVNTLFTLITPSMRVHLHLLSRLAFILRDPGFKAALKRQAPREELLEALGRSERAIPNSRSSDTVDTLHE